MASGSLFQCLEIKYDAKIESAATPADDIHEILKEYLAPGELTSLRPHCERQPTRRRPSTHTKLPRPLDVLPHREIHYGRPALLTHIRSTTDHTTSPSVFETHLAQDATSFRPFGTRIGSYSRPSGAKQATNKGKGKGKADDSKKRTLNGGDDGHDEGDVVYEMWKVSPRPSVLKIATPGAC